MAHAFELFILQNRSPRRCIHAYQDSPMGRTSKNKALKESSRHKYDDSGVTDTDLLIYLRRIDQRGTDGHCNVITTESDSELSSLRAQVAALTKQMASLKAPSHDKPQGNRDTKKKDQQCPPPRQYKPNHGQKFVQQSKPKYVQHEQRYGPESYVETHPNYQNQYQRPQFSNQRYAPRPYEQPQSVQHDYYSPEDTAQYPSQPYSYQHRPSYPNSYNQNNYFNRQFQGNQPPRHQSAQRGYNSRPRPAPQTDPRQSRLN